MRPILREEMRKMETYHSTAFFLKWAMRTAIAAKAGKEISLPALKNAVAEGCLHSYDFVPVPPLGRGRYVYSPCESQRRLRQ